MKRRWAPLAIAWVVSTGLSSCGTEIPQIQELWEGADNTGDIEYRIKENIFCETVAALREVDNPNNTINDQKFIPDDYGMQMQINLTVEESGSFSPGMTYSDPLAITRVRGSNVSQSFNLGLGATISSAATRTDTSYSYYNVGRITAPGANSFCTDKDSAPTHNGSSPLLRSELGIQTYLKQASIAARALPSSKPPIGDKSLKLDVYSYDIKFVIVTSGSVTPTWKLARFSVNPSSTLFGAGRTRTHELILTFGPGEKGPSESALQTHFTTQIVNAQRDRGGQ